VHSKTSFALLQLPQKSSNAISCDEVACFLFPIIVPSLYLLHLQVFNAVVVFSEAFVENESGARVPVPLDFLKTSPGAADAFNALPRTCEKMAVVKRSAEEDNDNERWRSLSFVPI
jgi:hypothetical protein